MLPQIVMLFLPGWIFVWVYRFISRRPYKKISFSIEIIVTSYVLSLIIPSLLSPIDKVFGSSLKSSPTALLFVALMLGTFLGYLRRLPKAEKLSEAYQGSGLRSLESGYSTLCLPGKGTFLCTKEEYGRQFQVKICLTDLLIQISGEELTQMLNLTGAHLCT